MTRAINFIQNIENGAFEERMWRATAHIGLLLCCVGHSSCCSSLSNVGEHCVPESVQRGFRQSNLAINTILVTATENASSDWTMCRHVV